MRNAIRLLYVVVWLTVLTGTTNLQAAGGKKLMLILDASGSMWGQMEGRTKIEIARDVLADVIRELPDNTEVGLVAYGHRVKGDCTDVEELVPLGTLDRERLISSINGIQPKGMTPMIYAVSETAKRLKPETGETTILLVSDGKETCADNPCRDIARLKADHINFVLHIIGFNVTAEEKAQLTCMAEAGGGPYFSADDTAGLKGALQQIRETVSVGEGPGKLKLDKKIYVPRGKVTVEFEAQPDYADNAWVGIVPSSVPHGKEHIADQHETTYRYLRKKTSGTLTMDAPAEPGDYDMRMFNTDSLGVETASVPFSVAKPDDLGSITLDKAEYAKYDPIHVTFVAYDWYADNAWMGIVPPEVPHGKETDSDGNYITYQYIRGHDGKITFQAPGEMGTYTMRMFDSDSGGKETASVTFVVNREPGNIKLSLEKTTFSPGETIILTFQAPPTLPRNAWIGIVPSHIPHGDESTNDDNDMGYNYISNRATGTMEFTAPDKPGSYDFRMHDTDSSGKELTHITFEVK